jgi:polar amino acid transport system substrate-binding protein
VSTWFVWLSTLAFLLVASFQPVIAVGQPDTPPQKSKKLIVGVTNGPPYSMQREDGTWYGITVELWEEVAKVLKVDYEFKQTDLKGLQDALEKRTIDVGATGIAITSAREARFDFSDPYFVSSQAVAVNADQQSNLLQIFMTTIFNWNLINLLFLVLTLATAGAIVLWLLEHKGASEHYGGRTMLAFWRSLFWSAIVLLGRELPTSIGWKNESPHTLAARMFGVFWMTFGVILLSIFTALLASLLTSKQLLSIVNSQADLRHVRVGTVAQSAAQDILDRRHIKYVVYPGPIELATALTEHRLDAAIYGGGTMAYFAKTLFNNRIALRLTLRQDFLGIPLAPGSDLRRPLNKALLKVIEGEKWHSILTHYLGGD